jgi:hypothetical protein
MRWNSDGGLEMPSFRRSTTARRRPATAKSVQAYVVGIQREDEDAGEKLTEPTSAGGGREAAGGW